LLDGNCGALYGADTIIPDLRQLDRMIMDRTVPRLSDPRAETFGYQCSRCLKCCHHKRIQLNPYEIARLARNRGLTTSEFRAAWTEKGVGLALSQTENGACVFLGSEGCTVHTDRPLACRLYPLGRHLSFDGAESFSHVEPHPQSRGEFTRSGTIAEFLVAQGAHPFMRAADDYYYWLCAAHESLYGASDGEAENVSAEDQDGARELLDMDAAIARHCAAADVAEPTDIEARRELHLTILYQQLGQTGGGGDERT
jgi:Fe-S-cluster containining protein